MRHRRLKGSGRRFHWQQYRPERAARVQSIGLVDEPCWRNGVPGRRARRPRDRGLPGDPDTLIASGTSSFHWPGDGLGSVGLMVRDLERDSRAGEDSMGPVTLFLSVPHRPPIMHHRIHDRRDPAGPGHTLTCCQPAPWQQDAAPRCRPRIDGHPGPHRYQRG